MWDILLVGLVAWWLITSLYIWAYAFFSWEHVASTAFDWALDPFGTGFLMLLSVPVAMLMAPIVMVGHALFPPLWLLNAVMGGGDSLARWASRQTYKFVVWRQVRRMDASREERAATYRVLVDAYVERERDEEEDDVGDAYRSGGGAGGGG